MKKVNKPTKRFVMSILLVLALFTTFQAISGVKAKTIITAAYNEFQEIKDEDGHFFEHKFKSLGLAFKMLQKITNIDTQFSPKIAVASEAPKLEDACDCSKYPTQKVIATGYTAGYESTGKNPDNPTYGITYSGVKVKRDLYSTVAADLDVFPIGTILFIPGYGYGVVADKGGAIKGNKLDLFYETVKDVYNHWGKRTVEVYVVKRGNGSLTEEELVNLNENKSMQVFRQQYFDTEKE